MIFRKPFAFLIKHFKFIHLILTIAAIYLVFKTGTILNFYLEYINVLETTENMTTYGDIFNIFVVFSIIIIMIGSILIMTIMKSKNKPVKFYVINIIAYIFITGVYLFSFNVIKSLESGLVDIRTLKLVQDFLVITIILQILSLIALSIRTLGFDIKKFEFEQDLADLKITQDDSEEIELNLEFDFDKFKRNFKKRIRYLKYAYLENKIAFLSTFFAIIIVILGLFYLKIRVYNKIYNQNNTFTVNEYQLNIKNSYIVDKDYKQNVIDQEASFLIIDLDIKTTSDKNIKFSQARTSLKINNYLFHHQKKYETEFSDLGNIYIDQKITQNKERYLLVYEIPNNYKNKKMEFKYFDYNNKEVTVKLKPKQFKEETEKKLKLNQEINFNESILNNTKLKITNIEINNKFKNDYKFCLTNNNCINSYEYIVPSYIGGNDKTLLKITGNLTWDDDTKINGINDLAKFISVYGRIVYYFNNEEYINTDLDEVKPYNIKENIYYIEANKDLEKANKIYLDFVVRDKIYRYSVK